MKTVTGLVLDAGARCEGPTKWPRLTLAERFWAGVDKSGECWLWTKSKNRRGYGTVGIGARRNALTHRVAWVLTHGPLGPGELVLHSNACVSKACVRPDHLHVGDQKRNMRDAQEAGVLKGRNVARGERAGHAKLTNKAVLEIVRRYHAGDSPAAIGMQFGVSANHVTRLARGDEWSHVTRAALAALRLSRGEQ